MAGIQHIWQSQELQSHSHSHTVMIRTCCILVWVDVGRVLLALLIPLLPPIQSRWGHPFTLPPRGGGTPLYKLHRYVQLHRVGFLHCFGLKTGIYFAHFVLESGMVSEGTTGVYESIYSFNSKCLCSRKCYWSQCIQANNNLTGLITLLTYVLQDNCKWVNKQHQNRVYGLPHLFSPPGHA